ncbi:CBU_0592 family membrane protein [Yeosuana marina]|uniref:CBU_0592 family membrane protein n=1 Tax=Yeosuana marina TaxID=1565536 RepID=UPI0030EC882F|tara:strand:- start:2564 stop:2797 length:234 start_codon:yes stop_codon:yes gene_type:complete
MNVTDWIGLLGVFQILLAYILNVTGKASNKSLNFIILNITGAGMACLASILLNYWPFIILEGVWTMVSLYALVIRKT